MYNYSPQLVQSAYQVLISDQQLTSDKWVMIAPAAASRWSITFLNVNAQQAVVYPGGSRHNGSGFALTDFGSHIKFTFSDYPGMVGLQWWGITNGIAGPISVIDIQYLDG